MRHRSLNLMVLVISASLILTMAGCNNAASPASAPSASEEDLPTPTPVPTQPAAEKAIYKVERGDVLRQIQFSGRVVPVDQTTLVFRTDGRVRSITVKSDDAIKKGDIIGELQIDTLLRDQAKAQLLFERAQLRLKQAQDTNNSAIASAQLDLDSARIKYQQALAADPGPKKVLAEKALEQARIAVQQAQAQYDRVAGQPNVGASPQAAALQKATLDMQIAQANYDLAVQQIKSRDYDLQLLQKDVAKKEMAIQTLKDTGVDPLLKNDADQAQLEVQRLDAAVNDSRLIAPFDAKVLSVRTEAGKVIKAYDPQIEIGDPTQLEIAAELQSKDATDISVGQKANIADLSGVGKTYEATVRRVPNALGAGSGNALTGEVDKTTRLTVAQMPAEFTIGTLLKVTVDVERKNAVLWLPPQAIRSFEGRRFVVVQEGNRQRRVDIKVGLEGKDRTEVVSGLDEGQVVVGQ